MSRDNVRRRAGSSRWRWSGSQGLVVLGAGLVVFGLVGSGCYNAQELRVMAEAAPDPRQAEADKMWGAIGEVVQEQGWEVELARREELLLSTRWTPAGEGRRKRVRFLVLLAPMGMALNCTVLYERGEGEEAWFPDEEPATRELAREEEEGLVQAVYGRYKARR